MNLSRRNFLGLLGATALSPILPAPVSYASPHEAAVVDAMLTKPRWVAVFNPSPLHDLLWGTSIPFTEDATPWPLIEGTIGRIESMVFHDVPIHPLPLERFDQVDMRVRAACSPRVVQ